MTSRLVLAGPMRFCRYVRPPMPGMRPDLISGSPSFTPARTDLQIGCEQGLEPSALAPSR